MLDEQHLPSEADRVVAKNKKGTGPKSFNTEQHISITLQPEEGTSLSNDEFQLLQAVYLTLLNHTVPQALLGLSLLKA